MKKKRIFAYAKTKVQLSFAVTAKMISAFVFATRIVQFLFFLNRKVQALFCACTARFVSDLVGNSNCWFSHAMNHMVLQKSELHTFLNRTVCSRKIKDSLETFTKRQTALKGIL